MDEFLTDKERRKIQSTYEKFLNTAKPAVLVPRFYAEGLMSHYEKQKIDNTPEHKRADVLFHDVIYKPTYSQLKRLRRILFDEDHQLYATLLPRRNDDYQDEDILDYAEGLKPKAKVAQQPAPSYNNSTQESYHTRPQQHGRTEIPMEHRPTQQVFSQPAPGLRTTQSAAIVEQQSTIHYNPQPTSQHPQAQHHPNVQYNQGTQHINPVQEPNAIPVRRLQKYYDIKKPGHGSCGNGLVAIFANFTDHLTGYNTDIEEIYNFFKDYMHYPDERILRYRDLCKDEFNEGLDSVKNTLRTINGSYIDRLYVFILSHGNEDGIKMCERGSGSLEEKINGESVIITEKEIVERFTHESTAVPYLKGCPKSFFIQACQGETLAKPAAQGCDRERAGGAVEAEVWQASQQMVTVGADTILCKASCPGTQSWVPDTGSWFIQHICDIFRRYYKSEDLISMLAEVNDRISLKACRGEGAFVKVGDVERREEVVGRQMSAFTSTLTKKFYLSIPPPQQ